MLLPSPSWTDTVTVLPKKRLSCDASRARIASSCLHTAYTHTLTSVYFILPLHKLGRRHNSLWIGLSVNKADSHRAQSDIRTSGMYYVQSKYKVFSISTVYAQKSKKKTNNQNVPTSISCLRWTHVTEAKVIGQTLTIARMTMISSLSHWPNTFDELTAYATIDKLCWNCLNPECETVPREILEFP